MVQLGASANPSLLSNEDVVKRAKWGGVRERQRLQVRTPPFKEWFGDWENVNDGAGLVRGGINLTEFEKEFPCDPERVKRMNELWSNLPKNVKDCKTVEELELWFVKAGGMTRHSIPKRERPASSDTEPPTTSPPSTGAWAVSTA